MRIIENPTASDPDRAAAYGEIGVLLMAAEYRRTAEGCFVNAQALAPADMRWPYYLGHLHRLQGDLSQAARFFERTLQLKPDDVPALVWLAAIDVDLSRPELAEPLLNQALTLQPQSVAVLYWQGRIALARRDYRLAVERLEQGLAINRRPSKLQYLLATAYRGLGNTVKAEALAHESDVREVELDDPLMRRVDDALNSAMAYRDRGNRALDAGKLAEAAMNFRKASEIAPLDPLSRHQLGTVLFLNGDVEGAIAQFTNALRVAPHYAKAHYSLALVMDSRGQTGQALRELTAAVNDDPSYLAARLARADVLRAHGSWEASLADYQQALKLDAGSTKAILGSAMALVHLKRFADARDRLVQGTALQPNQPEIAHALARLLAAAPDDQVRDGRRAMSVMQARLQTDPRSVDLAEATAMASAEIGQWGDAMAWQRQAIAGAARAGRLPLVERLTATLNLYDRHIPCRTPWIDQEDLSELATLRTE